MFSHFVKYMHTCTERRLGMDNFCRAVPHRGLRTFKVLTFHLYRIITKHNQFSVGK